MAAGGGGAGQKRIQRRSLTVSSSEGWPGHEIRAGSETLQEQSLCQGYEHERVISAPAWDPPGGDRRITSFRDERQAALQAQRSVHQARTGGARGAE